jgi:hypothetical protein
MKIGIYNHETQTNTEIQMTAEEIEARNAEIEAFKADKAEKLAELQSAENALLSNLNITREQAELLGLVKPIATTRSKTLS